MADGFAKDARITKGEREMKILMIGDSLSSDIFGAASVGMDSCWFNTRGHKKDGNIEPTYEIERLDGLLTLLK